MVTLVWLSHVLSEASRRMNHVQEWSKRRKEIIRVCGSETFEAEDMIDERIYDILRALSNNANFYV